MLIPNVELGHDLSKTLTRLSPISQIFIEQDQSKDVCPKVLFDEIPQSCQVLVGGFHFQHPNAVEEALRWLDSGAQYVVFSAVISENNSLRSVLSLGNDKLSISFCWCSNSCAVDSLGIPKERLLLSLPFDNKQIISYKENISRLLSVCSGVILCFQYDFGVGTSVKELCQHSGLLDKREGLLILALREENLSSSDIALFHKLNIHLIPSRWACNLVDYLDSADATHVPKRIAQIAEAFSACLCTDRLDGLYATVVTDESGVTLGLVYSSKESILAALNSETGVYYSRSRGGLWKKGDSSGNTQQLIRIDMDCDSDALRFMVRQHGNPAAFCHLNTRSCWGKERGLQRLQATLNERRKLAPSGSYTKKLFDDRNFLRSKLLEEAQELIEAESADHVAAEAADVIFFALVRCASAGVMISDIEKHLDKRSLKVSRRPGLSKPDRVAQANDILQSIQDEKAS